MHIGKWGKFEIVLTLIIAAVAVGIGLGVVCLAKWMWGLFV